MFVSVRDCFLAVDEFSSPVEGLRHVDLDAVEIELTRDFMVYAMDSREKIKLASDDDARAYRKHLEGLKVRPIAFLTAVDFSTGDPAEHSAYIARAIELADILGMTAIRVDSAMRKERELDFMSRVDLMAKGLEESLRRTSGLNVALGIENHGFQGNNLAFLLNVYRRVNSKRLGSTLDTGNFYWRGYPLGELYGILTILAPYAKHTHVKTIKYPVETRETMREAGWKYEECMCPIEEGDIDHKRVAKILADGGYDFDFCLENELLHKLKGDERVALLERDIKHLKDCINALKV